MTTATVDAAALGFDPGSPQFAADPYPVLTRLRDAGPAVHDAERDVWLIPRFAEVHAALRRRGLGRVFEHRFTAAEFGRDGLFQKAAACPAFVASERWSLLNLEPPNHTRIRRLITKVFTAKAVGALAPRIEQIARAAYDEVDGGEFDVVAQLAQPYSIAVICELLGVPVDAGPQFLDWSHAIVKMYEVNPTPAQQRAADDAAAQFIDYVTGVIAARRAQPGNDLISGLVQVADQGDSLTDDEIICTVIVLLNAGHEATVNTMGNGLNALLQRPDQWARVREGEVPTTVAVEELLRFDPPLQMFERWVLDEVVLAGRTFRRGERIAMLFGAANRDPRRFERADTFDVGRDETTHIGFGGGVHFCIGAPLARLELAILLDEVRRRAPALHLTRTAEYHPTFVIRGLQSLTVAPV